MPNNQHHVWDVDLVPNSVGTKDKGKPVYRAQLRNSRIVYDVEMIVDELLEDGSAIDRDTAAGLVHRFVTRCKRLLLQGFAVRLDNLVKVWGKVEGNWDSIESFTSAVHKKTVAVGNYASFNDELEDVTVEVASMRLPGSTALVYDVIDKATERDDNFITPGDSIIIKGEKIKLEGLPQDAPKKLEPGIGVFFIDQAGVAHSATRIDTNGASTLDVRVPANLPLNQEFDLHIVTRYSGSTPLNEPRTIIAPFKLNTIIVSPTPIDEDEEEEIEVFEEEDDEVLVKAAPVRARAAVIEEEEEDDDDEEFFVEVINPEDEDDDDEDIVVYDDDDDEEIIDEDDEEIIAEDPDDDDEEEEIEVIDEDDEEEIFTPPPPTRAKVKPAAVKPAPKAATTVKPAPAVKAAPVVKPAKVAKK